MNRELFDLYQEVIIDHGKNPRNFKSLTDAKELDGYNPLCGDQLRLFVKTDDKQIIVDATFTGKGCAISMASASLMCESVKGKGVDEAKKIFNAFHHFLTEEIILSDEESILGKLKVLGGVKAFPMRVKCATLAWHTLDGILSETHQTVTTESSDE